MNVLRSLPWSAFRAALRIQVVSVLLVGFTWGSASAQEQARVAILEDGVFGPSFPRDRIETELRALLDGEFTLSFPEQRQLRAEWSVESVDRALDVLLTAPDVDLVVTLGPIGTARVSRRGPLPKPVISPFALDPELQRLPQRGDASGVRNLNYLVIQPALPDAVQRVRQLTGRTRIGVVFFAPILEAIPELEEELRRANAPGNELVIVRVQGTPDEILAEIPSDLQAVVLAGLVQLDRAAMLDLAALLRARGIASLALLGRDAAELGFLAALTPESDWIRIARRVALNAQRALLGEDPGTFPTRFPLRPQLSVNLATARAIGVAPTFDVLADARLVGEGAPDTESRLDIRSAVTQALAANPELSASERALAAASEDIAVARSRLLPHLEVSGQLVGLDDETGTVRLGILPERIYEGTATLNQVVYDERAWAGLRISQQQQEARREEHEARRLDLAREVAVAYLQVLQAGVALGVRREDLDVTRQNLELARVRRSAGASGPSDVLRWESKVAGDRGAVIRARRDLELARMQLNRLLDRPPEAPFNLAESSLGETAPVLTDARIRGLIDTPIRFRTYRDFLVTVGLRSAPELRGVDAQIESQERRLVSTRRAFWQPSIAAQAEMSKADLERNSLPPALPDLPDDRQNYVLGLQLRLPLFSGGSRTAEVRRAVEQTAALRLERSATSKRVEQSVRSAAVVAGASSAQIALAQEQARAAEANLAVVTDAYRGGLVPIATILDAQNAAVDARLGAELAEYEHLVDLMNLQRTLGWFELLASPDEGENFVREAVEFVSSRGGASRAR